MTTITTLAISSSCTYLRYEWCGSMLQDRTKCKFMACFRMITPSVLIAFERSRFVFNTTQNALLKLFKRVHRQMPPTKTIHYSLVCWLADRPVRPSYTRDEWRDEREREGGSERGNVNTQHMHRHRPPLTQSQECRS